NSIDEVGAKGIQDLGRVMKQVMPKVAGRSDGKRVSELAKEMLS
ncbi:MAG TPA: GatB/YqeY domain-containing protein, partial [Candidatus Binatia bacterium]